MKVTINMEDDEALVDYFQTFTCKLLGYSENYYFRVMRKIEVNFIEEDVYSEEVFKYE